MQYQEKVNERTSKEHFQFQWFVAISFFSKETHLGGSPSVCSKTLVNNCTRGIVISGLKTEFDLNVHPCRFEECSASFRTR